MSSKSVEENNQKWIRYAEVYCTKNDPNNEYLLKGFFNSACGGHSFATAYNYVNMAGSFIKKMEVVTASDIDLDTYNAFFVKIGSLSSSTKIAYYHALCAYSSYLSAKHIGDDPMKHVKRPKSIETEETRERREKGFLSEAEVQEFLEEIKTSVMRWGDEWRTRNYAIALLFLGTGLRRTALINIDISDINMEEGYINVCEKRDKHKKVYLNDKVKEALAEWLEERARLNASKTAGDALFISRNGNRIGGDSVYEIVTEAGKCIEGKHITVHALRATFGTQLYRMTHDVAFVQNAMGHNSPTTTQLYIRGEKDAAVKKAADMMGNLF